MKDDNIKFSNRELEALDFAYIAHDGQYDKSGKPYIFHPIRVAFEVKGFGEAYFITALLHDVVEDCGITLDEIETRFGQSIRDAVDSVSRRGEHTANKEKYFDFIKRAKNNPIGKVVKMADIWDNMLPERVFNARPDGRYKKALQILEN